MSEHLPLAPTDGSVGTAVDLPQGPHVFTEEELGEYKEQDRYLPIANVARIMKGALPQNAKIAKDAKETVQECVSEFISFVTSEAAEKCSMEKRKTVVAEDIIYALYSLGFENYAETLKVYLARLRHSGAHVRTARGERDSSGEYGKEDPAELAALANETQDEADADAEMSQVAPEEDDAELEERFAEVVQKGTFAEDGDEQ